MNINTSNINPELYHKGSYTAYSLAPSLFPRRTSFFPPQIPNSISTLPQIPNDVILEIFSYLNLNLNSLAAASSVNKQWKQCADRLWKKAIYKEIAFSNQKWAEIFGQEIIKDEDNQEEFLSLPENIVQEYREFQCAFPEKKAKDALMLIRIPATLHGKLTLKNLELLVEDFFSKRTDESFKYTTIIQDKEIENNQSSDQSYWILMMKHIFLKKELVKRECVEKENFINAFVEKVGVSPRNYTIGENFLPETYSIYFPLNYHLPTSLELSIYFLAKQFIFKKPLSASKKHSFIFSKNKTKRGVVVGLVGKAAIFLSSATVSPDNPHPGYAFVKKL